MSAAASTRMGKRTPRFAAFTTNISGLIFMRLWEPTFSISRRISVCSSRVIPSSGSKASSSRPLVPRPMVSLSFRALSRSPSMYSLSRQSIVICASLLPPRPSRQAGVHLVDPAPFKEHRCNSILWHCFQHAAEMGSGLVEVPLVVVLHAPVCRTQPSCSAPFSFLRAVVDLHAFRSAFHRDLIQQPGRHLVLHLVLESLGNDEAC